MSHQADFFFYCDIQKFPQIIYSVKFSMSKYGHSLNACSAPESFSSPWKSHHALILLKMSRSLLSHNAAGRLQFLKIVELWPLVFVGINWVCPQVPKPCSFPSTWEYSGWVTEEKFTSSKPGREFFALVSWVWRLMKSIHLCHVLLTRIKHRNSGQKGTVRKVDCRTWPPWICYHTDFSSLLKSHAF